MAGSFLEIAFDNLIFSIILIQGSDFNSDFQKTAQGSGEPGALPGDTRFTLVRFLGNGWKIIRQKYLKRLAIA